MNKIVLILFISLGYDVYSQKGNISIGIENGVNISKIQNIEFNKTSTNTSQNVFVEFQQIGAYNDTKIKPIINYQFGSKINYNLTDRTFFIFNLSYERKGVLFESMINDYNNESINQDYVLHNSNNDASNRILQKTKVSFDYVIFQPLFRYSIGNKLQPFINIGPYFGYAIGQKTVVSDKYNSNTFNELDFFKKLDFGVTSGLGITTPLNEKTSISFEVRNNLGIININEVGNAEWNNMSNGFLIGLNYQIN